MTRFFFAVIILLLYNNVGLPDEDIIDAPIVVITKNNMQQPRRSLDDDCNKGSCRLRLCCFRPWRRALLVRRLDCKDLQWGHSSFIIIVLKIELPCFDFASSLQGILRRSRATKYARLSACTIEYVAALHLLQIFRLLPSLPQLAHVINVSLSFERSSTCWVSCFDVTSSSSMDAAIFLCAPTINIVVYYLSFYWCAQ